MAGTDGTRPEHLAADGPAVILIDPQLGENIGMVARAMLNCGLTDLRLVRPRDGWPNPAAVNAASGADTVLDAARLFETTSEAIADRHRIYATTARRRDMTKPEVTPRCLAAESRTFPGRVGVLFGKEAKGLTNDDVALADAIVTVPLNPAFSSLNLAQAVLLIGYEWYQAGLDVREGHRLVIPHETRPATKKEMAGLFKHLERDLDACGFLRIVEKRPIMVRNLRNTFQRAALTEQEVRTLRGIITCLRTGRRNEDPRGSGGG